MNKETVSLDDLLKAGEFARLCGTTKETLRHYRNIGLLVPVAKAKNGYQLYSPLQLSDYLLVSSLQQAGCSLHEIKGYLSEPDSEALESVMEGRTVLFVEQRRALLMQKSLLENTLARMRARNDWRREPQNSSSRRARPNTSSTAISQMHSFRLPRRIFRQPSKSSSLCRTKKPCRSDTLEVPARSTFKVGMQRFLRKMAFKLMNRPNALFVISLIRGSRVRSKAM